MSRKGRVRSLNLLPSIKHARPIHHEDRRLWCSVRVSCEDDASDLVYVEQANSGVAKICNQFSFAEHNSLCDIYIYGPKPVEVLVVEARVTGAPVRCTTRVGYGRQRGGVGKRSDVNTMRQSTECNPPLVDRDARRCRSRPERLAGFIAEFQRVDVATGLWVYGMVNKGLAFVDPGVGDYHAFVAHHRLDRFCAV